MIPQALIDQAREFAYSASSEYGTPILPALDLSNQKGQWLAEKLKANKEIVLLGTLLMDCMLGVAVEENRILDHIEMSALKAEEIISTFPEITEEEKQNIVMCIREHHGVSSFYSLESEICCNADCYRFASCKGMVSFIRCFREMELADLVVLAKNKLEEKWNALSLGICKEELEPQYKINKQLLNSYSQILSE